jgi:Interferon-related developmental regulator (IFRD)/Interferon-related protein conserved region
LQSIGFEKMASKGKGKRRRQDNVRASLESDEFGSVGSANNSDEEGSGNYNFDESSDSDSDASTLSALSYLDKIGDGIEELGERRGERRIVAYKTLSRTMALCVADQVEQMQRHESTLVEFALKSLRKGNAEEKMSALEMCKVMCVSLGTESACLHSDMHGVLAKLVKDKGSAALRASAMETLAIVSFIDDEPDLEGDLAVASAHFGAPMPLARAAMRAYALLATTLPNRAIANVEFPTHADTLCRLLAHDNLDARQAAGEVLALMFEAMRAHRGTFDIYDCVADIDVDELLDTLTELARESTRRKSKKELFAQRRIFKNIERSIVDDELDADVVVVNKQKFYFDSWARIVQLDAFRAILRSGLQAHMLDNELLHQVFDMNIDRSTVDTSMSHVQKRLTKSKNSAASKARTQSRDKSRRNNQRQNLSMLDNDD